MAIIEFRKIPEKIVSAHDLKRAVDFFLKKLSLEHPGLYDDVKIRIQRGKIDPRANIVWYGETSYKPKSYLITVRTDRRNYVKFLSDVAHELAHTRQYLLGHLIEDMNDRNQCVYHGQSYNETRYNYWRMPYEIEAYGWERVLMIEWLAYNREEKLLNRWL